ncbi:alpha-N-methyltransferase NTM1 [Phlyctochytrium arcticum]|nr:alpha-N-methyltransferase NTM1 [Phlyctochytrium arcticum]
MTEDEIKEDDNGKPVGGPTWYTDAADYWGDVEPTVEGMLGGFGRLTELDCRASARFINPYVNGKNATRSSTGEARIGSAYACDCGAGIGRVSKNFLLKIFEKVDLVEQNPKFLEEAKESFLGEEYKGRVGNFFAQGLQDFQPEANKYDLIWTQWVLGHLTDDDFVAYFKRCKLGLKPNGLIGVKENVSSKVVEVDNEDSSVTRPVDVLEDLFARAGLRIVKKEKQKGFPPSLFGVYMYLLE